MPESSVPEPSVRESPVPGRTLITRRAMVDVVRAAVLGSYGVTGFADRDRLRHVLRAVGFPTRGIDLSLDGGIGIDIYVTVAHGLPVAEVARQVDSAVRHALRHAIGRDVTRLVVHVNGLRVLPTPVQPPASRPIGRAGAAHDDTGDIDDADRSRGPREHNETPLSMEPSGRIRAALRRTARADGGRR